MGNHKSENGTALAMILAAGNIGKTILKDVLVNAELIELGVFLQKMGIRIIGLWSDELTIISNGLPAEFIEIKHRISSDRPEIIFWLVASTLTGGAINVECDRLANEFLLNNIKIKNEMFVCQEYLKKINFPLCLTWNNSKICFAFNSKLRDITANNINILYTDRDQTYTPDAIVQLLPLLLFMTGKNTFTDDKYGVGRLQASLYLKAMGAVIETIPDKKGISIVGGMQLKAAEVDGMDIRSAAILLLTALTIHDVTIIYGANHLLRAYTDLFLKLKKLGAEIIFAENKKIAELNDFTSILTVNSQGEKLEKTIFLKDRFTLPDDVFVPYIAFIIMRRRKDRIEFLLQRPSKRKLYSKNKWECSLISPCKINHSDKETIIYKIQGAFLNNLAIDKKKIVRIGVQVVKSKQMSKKEKLLNRVFVYQITTTEDNKIASLINKWVPTLEIEEWGWSALSDIQDIAKTSNWVIGKHLATVVQDNEINHKLKLFFNQKVKNFSIPAGSTQ